MLTRRTPTGVPLLPRGAASYHSLAAPRHRRDTARLDDEGLLAPITPGRTRLRSRIGRTRISPLSASKRGQRVPSIRPIEKTAAVKASQLGTSRKRAGAGAASRISHVNHRLLNAYACLDEEAR